VEPARPEGRFPAAQRVLKRSEFQRIQAHARRVNTPHFCLLIVAREARATGARLGVTASRRIGNSVLRSRAKRLIREGFRATRDLWPPDVDVVVVARRAPADMKLDAVVSEWRAASRQIGRRIQEARRDRQTRHSELADRS
jgi:ribonuclease P protein component